ncbi:unnamed protein product [Effrenium voratum]|nr:unnamed protein product [Effrenium voratum]
MARNSGLSAALVLLGAACVLYNAVAPAFVATGLNRREALQAASLSIATLGTQAAWADAQGEPLACLTRYGPQILKLKDAEYTSDPIFDALKTPIKRGHPMSVYNNGAGNSYADILGHDLGTCRNCPTCHSTGEFFNVFRWFSVLTSSERRARALGSLRKAPAWDGMGARLDGGPTSEPWLANLRRFNPSQALVADVSGAEGQPRQCGQLPVLREPRPEVWGLSKGSISQLQEFVQGAKLFPMPPNCPVLQWAYETREVGNSSEFCATCSFLLDGVAHHTVGAWRSNKKLAQRDAAERTLGLFVTRWASLITLDELAGTRGKEAVPQARSEVELLEKFSRSVSACKSHGDAPVSWSHRCEDGEYQAFAEVRLLEVPHTFPGRKQPTLEAAYEDSARRVLWYLQCPGYEDMFEPDDCYVKAVAQETFRSLALAGTRRRGTPKAARRRLPSGRRRRSGAALDRPWAWALFLASGGVVLELARPRGRSLASAPGPGAPEALGVRQEPPLGGEGSARHRSKPAHLPRSRSPNSSKQRPRCMALVPQEIPA